jgi:hypothetical protein
MDELFQMAEASDGLFTSKQAQVRFCYVFDTLGGYGKLEQTTG